MQEQTIRKWSCRVAPSLGDLEDTHQNIWGTENYINHDHDDYAPVVFFGLYGLPDFYTLWRHKGRKAILWAGSDITHFGNGYWLDEVGEIRVERGPLAIWINKNCENYVENYVEKDTLKEFGIESTIVPSFLGNVNNYEISYQWSDKPKLYTSVSGDNFELYGWDKIHQLALDNPDVEFHLYGNTIPFPKLYPNLEENIIVHGKVPKEQMNEEIKDMQGALRLTEFDGFSEIIAKSLLLGQWPVSFIDYPGTIRPSSIHLLKNQKSPNTFGRNWLLSVVNKYPWNQK